MFLVSFFNLYLLESTFLLRELAPASATTETGPVSVSVLRRPQLMSVTPGAPDGRTALGLRSRGSPALLLRLLLPAPDCFQLTLCVAAAVWALARGLWSPEEFLYFL